MSMDASGTIAGAIVFSRWKGLPYVRRHAIPSNPRSEKQVSMRAMMSFLSRAWPDITTGFQELWSDQAETMHQSGFNRFVGVNQSRWRHFTYPSASPDISAESTAASAPTVTATGGVREANLAILSTTTPASWGWAIFAKLGSAPTPSISSLVGVIGAVIGSMPFVHTPIAAGTWHYIVIGFNLDTVQGAPSTDATATVT
jgi:hypothetical protein